MKEKIIDRKRIRNISSNIMAIIIIIIAIIVYRKYDFCYNEKPSARPCLQTFFPIQ